MKKLILCLLILLIPASSFAAQWFTEEYGVPTKNDLYNPAFLPNLIKMLDDKHYKRRIVAMKYLLIMDGGAHSAINRITEMSINDKDEDVRQRAQIMLKQMKDQDRLGFSKGLKTLTIAGKKIDILARYEFQLFNGFYTPKIYRTHGVLPVYITIYSHDFVLDNKSFKLTNPFGNESPPVTFEKALLFLRKRGSKLSEPNRMIDRYVSNFYLSEDNPSTNMNTRGFALFDIRRGVKKFDDWKLHFTLKSKTSGTTYLIEASNGYVTVKETMTTASTDTITTDNIEARILKLKYLLNNGLITKQEYNDKRKELLNAF